MNIRYFSTFIIFIIFMLFLPQLSQAQEGNEITKTSVAVVDIELLLSNSKAAKSLQNQIKKLRQTYQKEFTQKEKSLRALEKSIVLKKEQLSAEEFSAQKKEFENKLVETKKLFVKRRKGLEKGLGSAMNTLRKEVVQIIAQISDQKGYTLVLAKESVVIVEKGMDITQEVMTQLDKRLPDIKLKTE